METKALPAVGVACVLAGPGLPSTHAFFLRLGITAPDDLDALSDLFGADASEAVLQEALDLALNEVYDGDELSTLLTLHIQGWLPPSVAQYGKPGINVLVALRQRKDSRAAS